MLEIFIKLISYPANAPPKPPSIAQLFIKTESIKFKLYKYSA